jgi:hypothetical protein
MTNEINACEVCGTVRDAENKLTTIGRLTLCDGCYEKEKVAIAELSSSSSQAVEIPVEPSVSPMQDRLRKAYIDKFNTLMLSGMSHPQIKAHIADLEDMVKVLQTQIQATMDIDDEWSSKLSAEEREALRVEDKKYRAKARPNVNSDGTLKTGKPKTAAPIVIGDSGTKAFDSLVEKLVRTGMSKEMAENMIRGMKK